jgi:PIN domain nuclease of toxin-antitoxin system
MRLLLDTCTALWVFEGHRCIRGRMRDQITDPGHEVYLSDVSLLEIVIKYRLGKLPLAAKPSKLIPPLARRHAIDRLQLTAEAVFRLEDLPDHHRDPFDRLLVCQALAHGLTLVTPDPLIHRYEGVSLLWSARDTSR